jgi:molybdopterin-guanine dinucleotide biosynthesis protein A
MTQAAALVLAGGTARRLGGGDKPLRLLHGRTLLEHVLAALDVPVIAISANGDPDRFARFGLPVLADGAFEDHGPLAGVLAGMRWAEGVGAATLLTVPGDTPFLPPRLASALAPAPACATSAGQQHNLVALWRTGDGDLLQTFLQTPGSRNVSRFAHEIGMRYVDFPATDARWFVNVNTPDDLSRLESLGDHR